MSNCCDRNIIIRCESDAGWFYQINSDYTAITDAPIGQATHYTKCEAEKVISRWSPKSQNWKLYVVTVDDYGITATPFEEVVKMNLCHLTQDVSGYVGISDSNLADIFAKQLKIDYFTTLNEINSACHIEVGGVPIGCAFPIERIMGRLITRLESVSKKKIEIEDEIVALRGILVVRT
jgi:hypothetical protein